MRVLSKSPLFLAVATVVSSLSQPVFSAEEHMVEEVVVLGSRSKKPRTAMDSAVPIDVFSAEELSSAGNTADIIDDLKALVPSFTAIPATGDGSAFIRPTSLRGQAPDQTLVLVNGKRRHRSALVQFFASAAGNGAHAPDIGMIPTVALKNVEVLRDGASAQYGADAIAGVMNFQLKDSAEGGSVELKYGEYYEGEQSVKVSANGGVALGKSGFINASIEVTDNEALSRGLQRPDAQALIDGGVQGVGQDSPFDDAPFAQTWGRSEASATRFFINSGYDLSDSLEVYGHANYAKTEGRYRFFYRPGYIDDCSTAHSTISTLCDEGFAGLQQGYTPYLDGDQEDFSVVGGLRGELTNGLIYDYSVGYGQNALDYFLNNTLNPTLGLNASGEPWQRDFDVGGYEQQEINVNADFSKQLTDDINLAFGVEWREETYIVKQGEAASYQGEGSNGLRGFGPADAGEFDRDNYAVYVDIEQDITEAWMVQYAARYEDFSDFGSTLNGKLATRYRLTDSVALRAAVSTGFHAPTPGQSNVRTTITTFDGTTGLQQEEGLVSPTSPEALSVGGAALTEEKAINYSVGFTAMLAENVNLSVDAYHIEVDDRIYRTGDIVLPDGRSISFYTNALDVETNGIDVVLSANQEWNAGVNTQLSFAFNYNKMEVTDQASVGGILPVSDATVEDIEHNYPNERFVLSANTFFADNWNVLVRANYYGSHYDERGTIHDPVQPSAEIDHIVYIDLEVGYDFNENLRFAAGGTNIFDEYVNEIGEGYANRESVGLQYSRRTPANYDGGAWYLQTTYNF
ncbi:iron complex outermembrane receptor protein [Sinobacterium caligoides]|uniref:Iron complex outermembrane receptor protein n=1 Tax=Sinobacterium caligoides TaxID=933926 RepID=A0A3N2DLM5_9GAMM|nr:TonB-dependent receptor [Sinobacterium caligoides]ROS00255.1 iron complex outermembrane receptor protein [Sinobacterium caligoides]